MFMTKREHWLWAFIGGVTLVMAVTYAIFDAPSGSLTIITLVGAVLALLGSIGAVRAALKTQDPPPTLSDRIEKLRRNLTSSKQLIDEVNAEFELQAAEAERIKAEAEQNQKLAELNAEQADAVRKLVESVQGRASRTGTRQQWLFFLAGLLFAIPLGVAGNFAFELVKAWLAG